MALPALTRALKLQAKASKVGFDWNDPRAVLRKIREEADEIEAELDRRRARRRGHCGRSRRSSVRRGQSGAASARRSGSGVAADQPEIRTPLRRHRARARRPRARRRPRPRSPRWMRCGMRRRRRSDSLSPLAERAGVRGPIAGSESQDRLNVDAPSKLNAERPLLVRYVTRPLPHSGRGEEQTSPAPLPLYPARHAPSWRRGPRASKALGDHLGVAVQPAHAGAVGGIELEFDQRRGRRQAAPRWPRRAHRSPPR